MLTPAQYMYKIHGGAPVTGIITCLGAKNFVTKAMIASILADTPSILTNVPAIGDVLITKGMLQSIGVTIDMLDDTTMRIDPRTINGYAVSHLQPASSNRMPLLLLGPLLHRFDQVILPPLGGDKIGRYINFHIENLKLFGGEVEETSDRLIASKRAPLQGNRIVLPYPSVGATESCLLTSVLACGRTIITNAAIEPEVMELITMLRAMGAIIFTSADRTIRVEGVYHLSGTTMRILGDRIEAASWACLACASDGDITVRGIRPDTLGNFLSYFQEVGGGIELLAEDSIRFFKKEKLRPIVIETDVYPGFSTDWQQPFAILLTQADGVSIVHETVHSQRFDYLQTLNQLGAKTQVTPHCLGSVQCRYKDRGFDHSAIIVGTTPLTALKDVIEIPDLRAGFAYVVAAAIAEGITYLSGVQFLERGYGDIVPRLTTMNLDIERVPLKQSLPV